MIPTTTPVVPNTFWNCGHSTSFVSSHTPLQKSFGSADCSPRLIRSCLNCSPISSGDICFSCVANSASVTASTAKLSPPDDDAVSSPSLVASDGVVLPGAGGFEMSEVSTFSCFCFCAAGRTRSDNGARILVPSIAFPVRYHPATLILFLDRIWYTISRDMTLRIVNGVPERGLKATNTILRMA